MKLGYARISTSDQDASMPVEALLSVGEDPKRTFTDELFGAKEAKVRPGMAELRFARENHDIYFWRLDRNGRSVNDVLNTVSDFTSRGIRLHSIMDSLNPTSLQGKRTGHPKGTRSPRSWRKSSVTVPASAFGKWVTTPSGEATRAVPQLSTRCWRKSAWRTGTQWRYSDAPPFLSPPPKVVRCYPEP